MISADGHLQLEVDKAIPLKVLIMEATTPSGAKATKEIKVRVCGDETL